MKRMATVGFTVALAVLALGVPAPVAAQMGPGPGPRMRARGFEAERLLALLESDRGRQLLGISDEQATRLRQITVDAQKTAIRTKADLAVRGLELRELLVADNPDRATVLKKVDEVSALTGTLMKQHVEALLSAKTVLTPEQQQKIRELSANWRLMRGTRGGRPGMPGGPGGPPMAPRPAGPPSGPPPGEPPVE